MEPIRMSQSTPVKMVVAWMQRVDSREKLKQMSDRMLKDIGLTREEVDEELRKPFWRS